MVDAKKLSVVAGIDLSFLNVNEQLWVEEQIRKHGVSVTSAQAHLLKTCSINKELNKTRVKEILTVNKLKPRRIVIDEARLSSYFPENVAVEAIEATIFRLLDDWTKKTGGT